MHGHKVKLRAKPCNQPAALQTEQEPDSDMLGAHDSSAALHSEQESGMLDSHGQSATLHTEQEPDHGRVDAHGQFAVHTEQELDSGMQRSYSEKLQDLDYDEFADPGYNLTNFESIICLEILSFKFFYKKEAR